MKIIVDKVSMKFWGERPARGRFFVARSRGWRGVWRSRRRRLWLLAIEILILLLLGLGAVRGAIAVAPEAPSPESLSPGAYRLPIAAVHPLPPSLAAWRDRAIAPADHYLDLIEPSIAGPLLWTRFPIRVALDFGEDINSPPPSEQARRDRWTQAIRHAIAEWSPYLPLTLIESPTDPETPTPDITFRYQAPPLRLDRANPSGIRPIAAAGRATYRLVPIPDPDPRQPIPRLGHRCEIFLTPGRPDPQLLDTARHELGHALGLWGHSDRPTDLMYFRPSNPPNPIRDRDLNTLALLYQQPTHLGWPLQPNPSPDPPNRPAPPP